jgi:glutaredoxin 3
MASVVLYTSGHCPYCIRAKSLLDKKKVIYQEIRIDLEPTRMQEMIERSSGRRTVPQIFINHQHIGGFDDLWALEQSGELDKLLEKV